MKTSKLILLIAGLLISAIFASAFWIFLAAGMILLTALVFITGFAGTESQIAEAYHEFLEKVFKRKKTNTKQKPKK